MKISHLRQLAMAGIIGALLVLPIMILEWINRRAFHEGYPFLLFGFLWLLHGLFVLTLILIIQNVRTGSYVSNAPLGILLRVAMLIFIAWLWTNIILDQMPCFLGVPICD